MKKLPLFTLAWAICAATRGGADLGQNEPCIEGRPPLTHMFRVLTDSQLQEIVENKHNQVVIIGMGLYSPAIKQNRGVNFGTGYAEPFNPTKMTSGQWRSEPKVFRAELSAED